MIGQQRSAKEVKDALEDLLKSDGWAIVRELVDQRFGPAAQLQEIDKAMGEIAPADQDGQFAVVTQIRAMQKAAYIVLALPKAHLDQIDSQEPKAPRLFEQFRRGPRPA